MTKLDRLPWLFAALLCLAGSNASAAEPTAGRGDPAVGKGQLKIELAPTPAPAAGREGTRAPAAKPPDKQAAAQAAESARKADGPLEFDQTPASEVVAFVAEYAGVNIVTDPDCAEKLKTPLSFRARGMTCRQVLDWAVRLSGTAWTLADGAIFVTSHEKLPPAPDLAETVRKFIVDNPALGQEPAKFEPPPEMGLPEKK
jgi:hypothetical protein